MRTIKENLLRRLGMQAKEAELQGMEKIADALTYQIEKHANFTRHDDAFYVYSEDQFRSDVTNQLWSIILRAADFYGVRRLDASDLQTVVEKSAEDIIQSFRTKTGVHHGVGAYEERVPGEEDMKVSIELDEEE